MNLGEKGKRGHHGVRIYCPVSHFAYDDPIVLPGQPGKAHLHMFFGNTSVDANTTYESLKSAKRSSCEGGTNMKSSYWMPSVFNAQDEVVIPERLVVYYKTFMIGKTPNVIDASLLNPIPEGLQMLASRDTKNAKHGVVWAGTHKTTKLKLGMAFPECVAVDRNGDPVLRYQDMPGDAANEKNSHVAYQAYGMGTDNDCPKSHPYRIPQVTMNVYYDLPKDSRWYLASDKDRSSPGHSLHADYIAAWDEESMKRVVACNVQSRSCEFLEEKDGRMIGRAQLWERFFNAEGDKIYRYSTVLEPGMDRTPFGRSLKPMLMDMD